jgi:hypothetical protein
LSDKDVKTDFNHCDIVPFFKDKKSGRFYYTKIDVNEGVWEITDSQIEQIKANMSIIL